MVSCPAAFSVVLSKPFLTFPERTFSWASICLSPVEPLFFMVYDIVLSNQCLTNIQNITDTHIGCKTRSIVIKPEEEHHWHEILHIFHSRIDRHVHILGTVISINDGCYHPYQSEKAYMVTIKGYVVRKLHKCVIGRQIICPKEAFLSEFDRSRKNRYNAIHIGI